MSYYYIDLVNLHDADWTETKPIKPVVVSKNDDKKIAINKDYTFQNVVFDFNSSELSKGAKSEIKSVYNLLTQNQGTKIIISGHTDNVGGSKFNQALSEKRAKSVTDYFISLGLEEGSISYFGYGNEKPIATNDTEDGRNKNRRVEFKIVENN
nr:OmpA family protein [Lacinutrix sp. C3R15]